MRKLRPPRAVSPDFETLCIRCGAELDSRRLLVRTLALYGFDVHEHELKWFAQAFWAQSIALKGHHRWFRRGPQICRDASLSCCPRSWVVRRVMSRN